MNGLFVPYYIAKQLKEIGFDEPCLAYYQNGESEPLSSMIELLFGDSIMDFTFPNNSQIKDDLLNVFGMGETEIDPISAPLYQQVFGWFRDKGYNLYIQELSPECFSCVIGNSSRIGANTYKKAEDNGILWLISLIKG